MIFSELVVAYLFLGGAGAGLAFWAAAFNERRLQLPANLVAALVLGLGFICLAADSGRGERALLILTNFQFTYANIGALSLGACIVLALLQAVAASATRMRVPRAAATTLRIATLIIAFITMLYTGLLLAGMDGIAFWRTPLLPVLFALSAASSGCALFTCVTLAQRGAWRSEAGPGAPGALVRNKLLRIDLCFVAAELAVLVAHLVLTATSADATASVSAHTLISGELSQAFWGLLVACGLVLPLALELATLLRARAENPLNILVICALVLAGAAALRYLMVAAASHAFLGTATAQSFAYVFI